MARLYGEAMASLSSTTTFNLTGYNPANWSCASLISKTADTIPYIAPNYTVGRPVETSAAVPGFYASVVNWSRDIDWVFLADQAATAATRRLQLYTYTKPTNTLAWIGFATLTYPTGTNHTIRGLKMTYDLFTTGTVGLSVGHMVFGSGTTWGQDRICSGSRIGFGSTDPRQISTWFEIASTGPGTDSTLFLSTSTSNLCAGTPYVIEDLRAYMANLNATAANGGLFVAKGLGYQLFTSVGGIVTAAGTQDNRRHTYWLANAASVTNTNACGIALSAKETPLNQRCWVLDSPAGGNYKVFEYNVRRPLVLAAGKDILTLVRETGNNAVTGTIAAGNNCRIATLNHGPTSGVPSLFFVTTSRIYGAPISGITAGSTTWAAHAMTEVPPGGVATYAATGALAQVGYLSVIDRLAVFSTGAAGVRSYITKFNTSGNQMDHIFLVDDKQIAQAGADIGIAPHPSILAVQLNTSNDAISPYPGGDDLLYLTGTGTAATNNILHVVPVGADWQYTATTNQRAISPEILTPNCNNYSRVVPILAKNIGSVNLGYSGDPFRVYYRTSGITDNSGGWTLTNETGSLSGVAGAASIQFMFEFKTITPMCIPARIIGVGVSYDDISTLSNYQPSVGLSNITNKQFAWRFATAFGGTVPTLRVRLYDAETGSLLVDDTTVATPANWEKSTNNGGAWSAYNTTDKANEDTYIRYTPTSLADNIKVRALLTLN